MKLPGNHVYEFSSSNPGKDGLSQDFQQPNRDKYMGISKEFLIRELSQLRIVKRN